MYDYSYSHAQSLINDNVRKERTYIDKNAPLYYDWFEGEFTMHYPLALLKNWNLQHANFDVLKLPVLEVCFYTPRSGCVAQAREGCTECVIIIEVNSGICYEFPPSQHTTNEQYQNRQ